MDTDPTAPTKADGQGYPPPKPGAFLRTFAAWFAWSLALLAVIATTFGYQTHQRRKNAVLDTFSRNLTQEARMFAARVQSDRMHNIDVITSQEGQAAGARATVIDGNGKVIADSESPVAVVEKEGRQPEFLVALSGSVGTETRSRNHIPVLYVAVPVSGGAVRLASPLSDVESASDQDKKSLAISSAITAVVACIICLIGAALRSRRAWSVR